MRILQIIDSLDMGGAQNLVVYLCMAYAASGHDVTILQLVESSDNTLKTTLIDSGVSIATVSGGKRLYSPFLIFKLIPWLKKYDVVHVHLFPALYWSGFARMLSSKKTPMVYTEHSTTNNRRNNAVLRLVDRFVYGHCYNEVIACSDKALSTFKESFPLVKSLVIPNGVDISRNKNAKPYGKKELLGIEEESFVVIMVARFASMKRQDTVVEAISKLPPRLHAVFVGGDEGELSKVEQLSVSLGCADRIHNLGIRSDVPRLLKTADVVLMASNYEGLSLSSIEGMACCRPFVASNVDGLREVVDGAGLLFENGNAEELAEILMRLATDSSYYQQVVNDCVNRASQYDIKNVAEQYVAEYKKFLC